MDWIHLVQYVVQCRAPVNTLISFWVRKRGGISWLAEQLSFSQEWLCFMQFVMANVTSSLCRLVRGGLQPLHYLPRNQMEVRGKRSPCPLWVGPRSSWEERNIWHYGELNLKFLVFQPVARRYICWNIPSSEFIISDPNIIPIVTH